MTDEIIFVYGWGPEEEGRVSSLLYLIETAVAMNLNVSVFLFTDGVILAKLGVAEKISESIGRRFKEILKNGKVKVYACEEAARKRSLSKENIAPGTLIIGYAAFLDKALNAKAVITV